MRFIIISVVLFIIVLISEYTAYVSLNHTDIIKSTGAEKTLMILGVILPLIFIVTMIYSYKHYSTFNSWLNTISSVWVGFVIYSLMASVIVFLLLMINYYFNINIPIKIISGVLMALVVILIGYGIWNSNNPRIVKWNINSEALSKNWKDKKIILISDVHLGMIRRENFIKKIISQINQEKPDIVFVAGDLIDGPSFPYEKWMSEISKSNPQFGNIYVEGNHEKYSQEYEKFKSAIPSSLIDLTGKKSFINETQIIGLRNIQGETEEDIKSELNSLQYDKNQPSIILIHDPKNVSVLEDENASLVLSGHTHGGQFFPFTMLVQYIYKQHTHGVTNKKNTTSVTSYGVGSSMIPFRIGTVPEIVVLTIK